jgi:hypothetical protein
MNRTVQITCYLSFLFAFSYVLIRGCTLGITHDEALTYKIIRGDEILRGTANHHWLNTHLSSISAYIFGAKEFALRLPNMLSFAVFGFFLLRIAKTFLKSPFTQTALVLLLCGNPFILDFFSLSRGYGLSIACVAASLFYLFKIIELKADSKPLHYYLATCFSILALSANLNTLNYFLVAQALLVFSVMIFKPKNRIFSLAGIILLSGIPLYFSLDRLFFLKDQKELYFGTGNLNATVDNLIYSGFYLRDGFKEVIVLRYLLYGVLLLAGFLAIRRKQLFHAGTIASVVLFSILIALVSEHYLFEALYPINRSSLYLYTIILLAILLNFDDLKLKAVHAALLVSSAVFVLVNIPAYNFNTTMTWSEDSAVKKAVLLIRQDIKDESIHLVECTWIYEPMINYYRLEYGIPVQEVFREDIQYKGEYLVIQNEWTPKPDYESILMDRTSGLAVYKRKVTSVN